MKTQLYAAVVISLLSAHVVRAQNYSIGWYKISGGGGASAGGPYQISGAAGQSEAGAALSGGSYSVAGGFWSLIAAVQTTGAPVLAITPLGGQVTVSWPPSVMGWTLQTNSNLAASAWGDFAGGISSNSVTFGSPPGFLFFRLAHP